MERVRTEPYPFYVIKKENVKMNNSNHIGNMNGIIGRSMIEWLKRTQKLKRTSMLSCAEHCLR